MGRKKRSNRALVARHVLTLRLLGVENDGLDELVRRQNVKLRELRLPAVVTRASYVRSLIHRELESLGLRSPQAGAAPEPESLVLVPPRKRLRKSIKEMPGPVTVERKVTGRTRWERIVADDLFDDPAEQPK